MIIPQTEWLAPTEYPDLRSANEIAIDLETRDPELKSKDSGSVIGMGEIVGFAVAVEGYRGYFPIAHENGPNMDRKKAIEWFKDICESPATKIFHNAMYDLCWIRKLGIKINGLIVDTMIASSLIDENRFSYTLNTLSWHHLSKGKNEKKLIDAAKERGLDAKADMWRLPAMEVGTYAEADASLTLELWQYFKKIIEEQKLQSIFDLETELFPCLVAMRFRGVRVDVQKAHIMKQELQDMHLYQNLLKLHVYIQIFLQIFLQIHLFLYTLTSRLNQRLIH